MKTRLFCFPYAGGSAAVFSNWKRFLHNDIEVVPVELSGRGRRMGEAFYESVDEAVEDIYHRICLSLDSSPYSFFGHSMGTLIVYELCKKIRSMGGAMPLHLFVSGRYPPHIRKEKRNYHNLPEDEFKEEIMKIGGTDLQVFEDKELYRLFIPILRSDYKLVEEYAYVERDFKLDCNVTVFNGRADDIATYDDLLQWRKHTLGTSRIYEFDGGHFFIHDHAEEVIGIINETMLEGFQ